jgi:aspartate/tyrosine/aromatic aminotransferase
MFEAVKAAPADPILGLTDAFKADANPKKVNLGVGVYQDEAGRTPVLTSVKQAEGMLLEKQASKSYMPIDGSRDYAAAVQELLFGKGHAVVAGERAATSHTPGGTGALRVAADYLSVNHSGATVWISEPTWANHPAIFQAAGLPTQTYPYFDAATNALDFDAMMGAISQVPAGDVVLLHGCCHNPTGVDPTPAQWGRIAATLAKRGVLPLLDFAYQGFGDGLDDDAAGLRTLVEHCDEMLIASSFSKNFGLYCERVGAMTVVARDADQARAVQSHVKTVIRRNYSNPPAHGGQIVATILGSEDLTRQWHADLAAMRQRINGVREQFVSKLDARGVTLSQDGNAFIVRQKGMFSFSGLDKAQVQRLRDAYSIYMVASGRINVAGLTPANIDDVCDAVAAV